MKTFLERIPRWAYVYGPMVAGSLIGWLGGVLGGWHATAGMVAGALAWLAWEMRRNTKSMKQQMDQMDEITRRMTTIHYENVREINQRSRPWLH